MQQPACISECFISRVAQSPENTLGATEIMDIFLYVVLPEGAAPRPPEFPQGALPAPLLGLQLPRHLAQAGGRPTWPMV